MANNQALLDAGLDALEAWNERMQNDETGKDDHRDNVVCAEYVAEITQVCDEIPDILTDEDSIVILQSGPTFCGIQDWNFIAYDHMEVEPPEYQPYSGRALLCGTRGHAFVRINSNPGVSEPRPNHSLSRTVGHELGHMKLGHGDNCHNHFEKVCLDCSDQGTCINEFDDWKNNVMGLCKSTGEADDAPANGMRIHGEGEFGENQLPW